MVLHMVPLVVPHRGGNVRSDQHVDACISHSLPALALLSAPRQLPSPSRNQLQSRAIADDDACLICPSCCHLQDGAFGIRVENLFIIKEAGTAFR